MYYRMRHGRIDTSTCLIALAICLAFAVRGASSAGKQGTTQDFAKLPDSANVAKGTFAKPLTAKDATKLDKHNHYSVYSKWFDIKPDANYTLGVVYRATGPSLVSAGVKWLVKGQPMGLVDREDHYACWPESKEWKLATLTFTSDPEYTRAQIILKVYGGMKAELKSVRLVEGWYSDR